VNHILVPAGIALLWLGGELLVNHSVRLSAQLGVRPLVIGLTVVAFGTSSPELAASLTAALQGAPAMALGNVIGSNILNMGAVLGLTALFFPLPAERVLIRREIPYMVAVGLMIFPLLADGVVGRVDGLILVGLLALYLTIHYRESRLVRAKRPAVSEEDAGARRVIISLLGIAAGIVFLTQGARALVIGAVAVAEQLGVSHRIIGITMVAFGTSLPELASSIVAARRGEVGLVLGNLVGSSIFNVAAILGITALVSPVGGSLAVVWIDLVVMTAIGIASLAFLRARMTLKRWEGGVLLLLYLAYIVYLFI
jgi:cation:H+ antiporter